MHRFGIDTTCVSCDLTLVQYLGRGHENFSDETIRLFDWMGKKNRSKISVYNQQSL